MCDKVEHRLDGKGRSRVAGLAGSVAFPPPPQVAVGAVVPEDHLLGVDEVGDPFVDQIRSGVGAKEKEKVRVGGGSANANAGGRPKKTGEVDPASGSPRKGSAPKILKRERGGVDGRAEQPFEHVFTGSDDEKESDPGRHLGEGVNRGRVDVNPPAGGASVTIHLDASGKVVGTSVKPGSEIIDAEFEVVPLEESVGGSSVAPALPDGVAGLIEAMEAVSSGGSEGVGLIEDKGVVDEEAPLQAVISSGSAMNVVDGVVPEVDSEPDTASQVTAFLSSIDDVELIQLFAEEAIESHQVLDGILTVEVANVFLRFLGYKGPDLTEVSLVHTCDELVRLRSYLFSVVEAKKSNVSSEVIEVAPVVEVSTSEPPVEEVIKGVVKDVHQARVPLSPTESFLRYVDSVGDDFDQCLAKIRAREKSEGKNLSRPAKARAFQLEAVSEILNLLGYHGAAISSVSLACLDELQLLCARRFTNGNVAVLDGPDFHQRVPSFIFRHESAAKAEAVAAIEAQRRHDAAQIALQRTHIVSKVAVAAPDAVNAARTKADLMRFLESQGRIRSRVNIGRDGREAVVAVENRIVANLAERLGITIEPSRESFATIVSRLRDGLAKIGISAEELSRSDSVPNFLKPR